MILAMDNGYVLAELIEPRSYTPGTLTRNIITLRQLFEAEAVHGMEELVVQAVLVDLGVLHRPEGREEHQRRVQSDPNNIERHCCIDGSYARSARLLG